jgi:DNA-binding protein H-NS
MEKLDLEAMPLDDLWALHEKISRFLSERMTAEKRQLEVRLQRLKQADETYGSIGLEAISARRARSRRKYPKVFPKYQNSKSPFETWAGRGRQPRWLVSALKAGGKIEDFEIPPTVRGRPRIKAPGQNRSD